MQRGGLPKQEVKEEVIEENFTQLATSVGDFSNQSSAFPPHHSSSSSIMSSEPTAIASLKRSATGHSPGSQIKRPLSHMRPDHSGFKSLGLIPQPVTPPESEFEDEMLDNQENRHQIHVDYLHQGAKTWLTGLKTRSRSKSPHENKLPQLPARQAGSFYGLPDGVKQLLVKKGITTLYEWQDKLMKELLATRYPPRNYIYSVPTSGGKTLVAELMMLDAIFNGDNGRGRNALMILPYVAIVQEKVAALNQFADHFPNLVVEEYAAQKGKIPPRRRRNNVKSIYVATIEKAHLLVTSLIEAGRFQELGVIVVDELHLIGEGSRGGGLENLLLKINLASEVLELSVGPDAKPRLLGMSATLSNMEDLKKFTSGEYWKYDFRPVELVEYLKEHDNIYKLTTNSLTGEVTPKLERILSTANDQADPSNLTSLVAEVVPQKSCLVFCPTKKHCESVALLLARLLPPNPNLLYRSAEKHALINELKSCNLNGTACTTLLQSIPAGVAYHHSGLTSEERQAIEAAYLKGTLSTIVCTSTLAAGVNLPAYRVIIRDAYVGRNFLTRSQYTQMTGRAGRAGFGDKGESYLMIGSAADMQRLKTLFTSPMVSCESALNLNDSLALESLILDLINLDLVMDNRVTELCKIITGKTLFGIQQERIKCKGLVEKNFWASFKKLKEAKLLIQEDIIQGSEKVIVAKLTRLGQATVRGLIDLRIAQSLYEELLRSMASINLDTNLHLIYISTFLLNQEDFLMLSSFQGDALYEKYETLADKEKRALNVMGFSESDIIGFRMKNKSSPFMWRLWITLLINDLWKGEVDFFKLGSIYGVHRGTLQNLISQLNNHANAILRFTGSFPEFQPLQVLLPPFCTLLAYRASPDLAPLLELPNVKIGRAKMLAQAGYKTIESISKCRTADLTAVVQYLTRVQASQIIAGARKIITDQAEELREAASELLRDMPLPNSLTESQ